MIRFACPSCRAPLAAPEECVGRTTKCRTCGQPLTVPGGAKVPPALAPVPPPGKTQPGGLISPAPPGPKSAQQFHGTPVRPAHATAPRVAPGPQPAAPGGRPILVACVAGAAALLLLMVCAGGGLVAFAAYRYLSTSGNGPLAGAPRDATAPPADPAPRPAPAGSPAP